MNTSSNKVSLPVIRRLPKYYRYVSTMQRKGITTVSSSELAATMGTTASQVRQDFNCFGGFGQQGIGYSVDVLVDKLEKLLFGGNKLDTILIGTGKLGRAIFHFLADGAPGYNLVALFDKSKNEIGQTMGNLTILDVDALHEYCETHKPQIAVLCIPEESAEELAPSLVDLGIQGFWNFSQYDLSNKLPGVAVENVHLSDSLMSLGYRARHAED